MSRLRVAVAVLVAGVVVQSGVVGCATDGSGGEERVVRYRPFFADNPEAWHGTKAVAGDGVSWGGSGSGGFGAGSLLRTGGDRPTGRVSVRGSQQGGESGGAEAQGGSAAAGSGEVEADVRLVAGSVGQLFGLLLDSLSRGEHGLIARDLVGRSTQEHYQSSGQSARVFVDELARNQREVARTLSRMPMAERTPTVFMERVDAGRHQVWVLRLTGLAAKDLRFSRVWVELGRGEDAGTWRIVAIR